VYAGTYLGLYQSDDGGGSWTRSGSGLPLVNVTDVYVAPDASIVRVATFGRGFWELFTPSPQPVTIAPGVLPNPVTGRSFVASLAASGATSPYTFAVTRGYLPGGLSLSSAGVIFGTPGTPGTYTFVVRATDSTPPASGGPVTGSQIYTLTILDGNPTVVLALLSQKLNGFRRFVEPVFQ